MNGPEVHLNATWAVFVGLLVFSSALVLFTAVARYLTGLPVIPYQPRRPVPWTGLDVLLIALTWWITAQGSYGIVVAILGPDLTKPEEKTTSMHLIARLVAQGNLWALVLAGISAVVVAPIVEEFLFRLVLQGWLEKVERRLRRRMGSQLWGPRGVVAVWLTTLIFAALHFRLQKQELKPEFMIALVIGNAIATLATMVFALVWLRLVRGASAEDFGWAPRKLPGDLCLGLAAYLGIAAPLYGLLWLLAAVLPEGVAPDPFALFFFALVLGTLYYRTHRLTPSVVLHMLLNGISVALAWFAIKGA